MCWIVTLRRCFEPVSSRVAKLDMQKILKCKYYNLRIYLHSDCGSMKKKVTKPFYLSKSRQRSYFRQCLRRSRCSLTIFSQLPLIARAIHKMVGLRPSKYKFVDKIYAVAPPSLFGTLLRPCFQKKKYISDKLSFARICYLYHLRTLLNFNVKFLQIFH